MPHSMTTLAADGNDYEAQRQSRILENQQRLGAMRDRLFERSAHDLMAP